MIPIEQSYRLCDFDKAELFERPEYASEGIAFDHVIALHQAHDMPLVWHGRCEHNEDAWGFIHQAGHRFEMWTYEATGWYPEAKTPNEAWPIICYSGTTYDGIRDGAACPYIGASPYQVIAAMQWVLRETQARGWTL